METIEELTFYVQNAVNNYIIYSGADVEEANEIIASIGIVHPIFLKIINDHQEIVFEQLLCHDKLTLN